METKITIPTGTVTAIGKFKVFKTEKFNYNIPVLVFIVAKKDDIYTASCLHLLLDASGKTENEAISRLQQVCGDYLSSIFKKDSKLAWDILEELFTSDCATEFWNGYERFKLYLSAKNVSMESNMEKYLLKRIQNLMEKIKKWNSSKDPINIDVVSYDTFKTKAA